MTRREIGPAPRAPHRARARSRRIAVALVATSLLHCAGGRDALGPELEGAAAGFDVVLVTLDTTRADRLGCYGYPAAVTPALDGLARRGVLFRNAATVAPATAPSHATILTGLYPPSHGVRANGPYRLEAPHTTLAEVLGSQGFATAAFVSAFVLDHRFGFAQGFETYDDNVAPKVTLAMEPIMERDATRVTDAVLSWLAKRDTSRPFFLWVHYFDPHVPYAAPPEFAVRFPASPYDAEIAHVDAELARLIRALEERGRLDRTLIVAVADHGEALGQHGELSHGYFVYDEVARVPLILSSPRLFPRPLVESRAVSVVDVVPTILDLLGLADPPRVEGRSLLFPDAPPERSAVYVESLAPYLDHGWAPLFALRGERLKYIRAPKPELYDLAADPGELRNLNDEAAGPAAEERDRLSAELERMLAGWPSLDAVAGQALRLDEETRSRLQALGYTAAVEGAGGAPGALADPKDMLPVYDRFQKVEFAADSGRPAEALPELRALVHESPGSRAAWNELAETYAALGQRAEAEAALRKSLSIQADPDALMFLAQILIVERRVDEVEPLIEQALALDPDFGTAIIARGDVAVLRGRFAEAEALYRRAAEVDPYRSRPLVQSRQAWLRRMQAEARGR